MHLKRLSCIRLNADVHDVRMQLQKTVTAGFKFYYQPRKRKQQIDGWQRFAFSVNSLSTSSTTTASHHALLASLFVSSLLCCKILP